MKTSVQAVADLVKSGSAFVHEPGGIAYTVGLMRQIEPENWFWWESGGDTEFHGHQFRADRAEVLYDGLAVKFSLKGAFVGYLTTIPEAIDDAEAATAAAQALKEWRAEYDRSESFRAFIEGEIRRRL